MNKDVKIYIDKQKSPQKDIIKKIRKTILDIAPQAEERMSYGVPAFILRDGPILYAAFKAHVGIYPEPNIVEAFKKELSSYETSKGAIKFPLDQTIPYNLIKKIVKFKNQLDK